jgi:hypothetical protein
VLTFSFVNAHNHTMPRRSSKPKDHDFAAVARRVVEQAIGEHLDGTPLTGYVIGKVTTERSLTDAVSEAEKNPAAVALGRLGGVKGGKARAAALSPKKRKMIAKKAAQARWKGKKAN